MKDRELRDLERKSGLDPEDADGRRRLRRSLARSDQEFDEGFLARVREALASSSWTVTGVRAVLAPDLMDDPSKRGRLLRRLLLESEDEAGDLIASRAVWALSPPGDSDLAGLLDVFAVGGPRTRAAACVRLLREHELPPELVPMLGDLLGNSDARAIPLAVRLGAAAEPLLEQIRDCALTPEHLPELAALGVMIPRLASLVPELEDYSRERLCAAISGFDGSERSCLEFHSALDVVSALGDRESLAHALGVRADGVSAGLMPFGLVARSLDRLVVTVGQRERTLVALTPLLAENPSHGWIHAAFLADWVRDRPRWDRPRGDRADGLLDRLRLALASSEAAVCQAACEAITDNLQSRDDRLRELRPELERLARDGVPGSAPGRQSEPKVGRGGATDRPERPRDRLDDRLAEPIREPGAPVPTSLCEVYREDDDEVREAARQALAAMDEL